MTNKNQYSFWRGLCEVPPAKRKELEAKLMVVLGLKFEAYKARRRGSIEPRASEVTAIEGVFAEFNVSKSKVWGPKISVDYEKIN